MMNSSSNQLRLYVVGFCVLTIVCVCQLGFWSFRGDLLQFQWVIIQLDVTVWSNDDDSSNNNNSILKQSSNTSASISTSTNELTTSASTSSRTTASQTFTTGYDNDDDDDGCQLTSHPKNIHWTTKKKEDNNASSSDEQMHIRRVHQCARRFSFTYVEKPSDTDWWPSLSSCDVTVTTELLQSVVQKHNRILFVGDSVLRQQYLFLLCMIDPTFERIQVKKRKDQFHYQSYYRRPDGGMTSLIFEAFGHAWPMAQRSTLYNSSFPHAIETYTEHDAIVVNANSHYNALRQQLLIDDIRFVAQQTARTNASVYLMEPSPEEWPTGNGFYIRRCKNTCHCESLTAERLVGRVPYPESIQNLLVVSASDSPSAAPLGNNATRTVQHHHHIPPFWDDLLQFLEERDRHNRHRRRQLRDEKYDDDDNIVTLREAANHTHHDYNESCQQDCFPATWRTEVVRGILLPMKQEKSQSQKSPPIIPSQQRTMQQNSVHVVPTFLQSVLHHGPSSIRSMGDCTHKSLDAVLMLNEQLIRTMLMVQANRSSNQHPHVNQSSSSSPSQEQPMLMMMMPLPAVVDTII